MGPVWDWEERLGQIKIKVARARFDALVKGPVVLLAVVRYVQVQSFLLFFGHEDGCKVTAAAAWSKVFLKLGLEIETHWQL